MISSLNTRVTVLNYTTTQDADTGKPVSILTSSWDKWAEVRQDSGNRALDNAAITYTEVYRVRLKYEISRPTLSKYQLSYKSKRLNIHSVIKENDGNIWWEKILAFTST